MKPTRVYDLRHNGVRVRLHVGPHSMAAVAQMGRLASPVRVTAPHAGLLGPRTERPHETPMAKSLIREASDRALGVVRRGAFDLLVDELHAQQQRRRGRPLRKSVVIWRKPLSRRRMLKIGAGQRVIFFSERVA